MRDIFYVEIEEEIADLYERFSEAKGKELVVVLPKQSMLIKSKISLKLLAKKAKALEKKLILITKDTHGTAHAKALGIVVHTDLASLSGTSPEDQKKAEEHAGAPLGIPQVQDGKKFTMVTNFLSKTLSKVKEKMQEPELSPLPYRFTFTRPGKKLLFSLVILSLLLFLFIGYIAIPGATVYIDPQVVSVERSLNIVFLDKTRNPTAVEKERTVEIFPLDVIFEREVTIGSTGENFQGTNAQGEVELFNMDSKERPILQGSRLQTEDGLLFLTTRQVSVPAKKGTTPGTVKVPVSANTHDALGASMGDRGNIGPTKLFFPGLSESGRKLVWGESKKNFHGGVTKVEKFVKPEDIEAAKKKVAQELEYYAEEELKKKITEITLQDGGNYVLFDKLDQKGRVVQKKVLEIRVPDVANQKLVSFQAYGKMHTKGWYYDQQEVYGILKKYMEERLSPTENLIKIDEKSMKFTTLFDDDQNAVEGRIKATVAIEGILSYNFFDSRTTLVRKIKQSIIGKSKQEAIEEINNLPQVRDVRISTWPIWTPTLPTIQDNIEIKISEVR